MWGKDGEVLSKVKNDEAREVARKKSFDQKLGNLYGTDQRWRLETGLRGCLRQRCACVQCDDCMEIGVCG